MYATIYQCLRDCLSCLCNLDDLLFPVTLNDCNFPLAYGRANGMGVGEDLIELLPARTKAVSQLRRNSR